MPIALGVLLFFVYFIFHTFSVNPRSINYYVCGRRFFPGELLQMANCIAPRKSDLHQVIKIAYWVLFALVGWPIFLLFFIFAILGMIILIPVWLLSFCCQERAEYQGCCGIELVGKSWLSVAARCQEDEITLVIGTKSRVRPCRCSDGWWGDEELELLLVE